LSDDQDPGLRKAHLLRVESSFSGAVPPPALMEQYKSIDPTFPERFFTMAELEQRHRIQMDTENQRDASKLQRYLITQDLYGKVVALVVVVVMVAAGVWLTLKGHDWVGGSVFTTSLVGAVALFFGQSKRKNETEPDQKTENPN
jgi:uncharacterized membrane protein